VTLEVTTDVKTCPGCGGEIKQANAIEIAHIFYLGDLYSKKMKATFTDEDGKQKPFIMGCYGIGIPRLMAAIVEANHDERGIIWPEKIAPFKVYLVELGEGKAKAVYDKLRDSGIEILYDDRSDSAGVKFSDADLLGVPYRAIVSEKTGDKIEVKKRDEEKSSLKSIDNFIEELRK
jgi:prolyl-tRNA synthetase